MKNLRLAQKRECGSLITRETICMYPNVNCRSFFFLNKCHHYLMGLVLYFDKLKQSRQHHLIVKNLSCR